MQINNNPNVSFKAIHAQTSKMTTVQKKLADNLTNLISYSDSYMKASNANIDVCLLPVGVSKLKAIFLDSKSEGFVRTAKDNLVTVTSKAKENCFLTADRIMYKLDEITSGKYKIEDFDVFKINSGKTDKAELFKILEPEEIDASRNVVDVYKQGL